MHQVWQAHEEGSVRFDAGSRRRGASSQAGPRLPKGRNQDRRGRAEGEARPADLRGNAGLRSGHHPTVVGSRVQVAAPQGAARADHHRRALRGRSEVGAREPARHVK